MVLILTVLEIVAPVGLLGAIGYLWVKTGHEYRMEFITRLSMTLSVPALIFTALMRTELDPAALTAVTLAAIVAYGALTLILWGVVKVLGLERRTYLAPLIFGNTGNVGLPLAMFAFGEAGLGYAVVIFAVMMVWSFTFGIWLVSGGGSVLRIVKEPAMGATLLGALFLWQGWQTPVWLTNSLTLLGQIAIPMMLITLGVAVARLTPGRLGRAVWLSLMRGGLTVVVGVAIDRRLTRILEATGWFMDLDVQVREGVVFIDARTDTADHQTWAGELAGKTSDVVAVVNRIRVIESSPWNLSPAVDEVQTLWKRTAQRLPRLGLGVLVMMLAVLAAWFAASAASRVLEGRVKPLLRDVAARILSILVFLVGFYLVLQVAGLSGLAATVLGGTGLAGLIAGFAFRDILENYLASILISTRNPFRIGDTVEIAGYTGIVLRVTTRGTVLMDLDGNHVQIPNGTVYKSIIRNFTANPNRRECFEVGIGFDNELAVAQEIALDVLSRHPAVREDPEALVLVDRLGSATVTLKVYFWYDGTEFNGPRIKSSLIRQVKCAFEMHEISMPDEDREILFPEGVPVRMLDSTPPPPDERLPPVKPLQVADAGMTSSEAEGSLVSEDKQLREQARNARVPEEGDDLLAGGPGLMGAPEDSPDGSRSGRGRADR